MNCEVIWLVQISKLLVCSVLCGPWCQHTHSCFRCYSFVMCSFVVWLLYFMLYPVPESSVF